MSWQICVVIPEAPLTASAHCCQAALPTKESSATSDDILAAAMAPASPTKTPQNPELPQGPGPLRRASGVAQSVRSTASGLLRRRSYSPYAPAGGPTAVRSDSTERQAVELQAAAGLRSASADTENNGGSSFMQEVRALVPGNHALNS